MAEQLCSAWRGSAGIPWSPARAELTNHRPVPHFSLLGLWGVAEAACLPSGLASPGLGSHLVPEAPAPEQGESRQKGGSEKQPRCLDVCAARGRDSQPSTFSPCRGVPAHPNGSLPSTGSALILSSLQICRKRWAFLRKCCQSSKRVSASLS